MSKRIEWRVYRHNRKLLGIRPAYYENEGGTNPYTYGQAAIVGSDLTELRVTLAKMAEALEKPILESGD